MMEHSRSNVSSDMITLSLSERMVAEEYCKGLTDKEVANRLCKSVWTIKTQKRTIYRKLGISKDTELLLYMLCDRLHREFDLKEIRKHGLAIFFAMLMLALQMTGHGTDLRRIRMPRRTEICGTNNNMNAI